MLLTGKGAVMSEQGFIIIAIVGIVAIVAVVALLALVVLPRKEASKNIIGGIEVKGNGTQVNIGQGAKAQGRQETRMDFKQNIKLHLYLFTFLPPSFWLIGVIIWWQKPNLSTISNLLAWAAGTLLIPAIIGQLQRPGTIIDRLVLILDMALLIFLIVALFGVTSPTIIGILTVISVAVIGLSLAARSHRAESK